MKKTLLFGMLLLLGVFLFGVKMLKAEDNEDSRSTTTFQTGDDAREIENERSQESEQQYDDSSAVTNTTPQVTNRAPSTTSVTPTTGTTQVVANAVRDDNQNGIVDSFEELLP